MMKRIFVTLAAIMLVNLACFTIKVSFVFDQDGSGSGKALLELIVPHDVEVDHADLADQGWQNIKTSSYEGNRSRTTAEYHFGSDPGEAPLGDLLEDARFTIEDSDVEYKYYTFEGNIDLSDLEEFWDTVKNDWAVNGVDGGELFGKDQYIYTAEDVQEMITDYGPPAFELSVYLPGQTPVDANVFWDNEDQYMAGDVAYTIFSWQPGGRTKAPLLVKRRLEPFECSNTADAWKNITDLLTIYETAIPSGAVPMFGAMSGHLNNRLQAWASEEGQETNFTCSDYQERVMNWLDFIRTNPNEAIRNKLEGLDYGPIMTMGGGHRAVVLFPSCTGWRDTGIILDPWPYQKPIAFRVKDWDAATSLIYGSNWPFPDADSGHLYPHLIGQSPSYPASGHGGDLSRGLAKPTKVLFVSGSLGQSSQAPGSVAKQWDLAQNSNLGPFSLLLTMDGGRKVGFMPDGSFVNDLPGEVDFYAFRETDGSVEWWTFLPDTGFEAQLAGVQDGDYRIMLAEDGNVRGYELQSIKAGETSTFRADSGSGLSPLTRGDGSTVQSAAVPTEQLEEQSGVDFSAAPYGEEQVSGQDQPQTTESTPTESESDLTSELSEQIFDLLEDIPAENLDQLEEAVIEEFSDVVVEEATRALTPVFFIAGFACLGVAGLAVVLVVTIVIPRKRRKKAAAPHLDRPTTPEQQEYQYSRAWLIVQGPNARWQHDIISLPLRIGSADGNQMLLHGAGVEPYHAEISLAGANYLISQLGSGSVLVNGYQITAPTFLNNGDMIRIGIYTITFGKQ